jgi:hypothetical protein
MPRPALSRKQICRLPRCSVTGGLLTRRASLCAPTRKGESYVLTRGPVVRVGRVQAKTYMQPNSCISLYEGRRPKQKPTRNQTVAYRYTKAGGPSKNLHATKQLHIVIRKQEAQAKTYMQPNSCISLYEGRRPKQKPTRNQTVAYRYTKAGGPGKNLHATKRLHIVRYVQAPQPHPTAGRLPRTAARRRRRSARQAHPERGQHRWRYATPT